MKKRINWFKFVVAVIFITSLSGPVYADPIHDAAKAGGLSEVKRLLSEWESVNVKDENGDTPLYTAANAGKIKLARLLISKGADVNAKNNDGYTPLHYAAKAGKTEMVSLFIDHGADINAITKVTNETPLFLAAHNVHIEAAKVLVSRGANVGKSDIVIAEQKGHTELGNFLNEVQSRIKELEQVRKELAGVPTSERKRAIWQAQQLSPPPVIPEEARRLMAEGIAAMKLAGDIPGYKEAKEKFEKSANLAPWWADAYFNLALVQEKLRKFDDAKRSLELYLLASPSASDVAAVKEKIYELEYLEDRSKKAKELIARAADRYAAGDSEGSIILNEEAIRLDPDLAYAHANLGVAYAKVERYKNAITELKEGLRLGVKAAYVYAELGRSYRNLDQRKQAISIMEEGVRELGEVWKSFDDQYGFLRQKLGRYYEESGQYEKALTNFEATLEYGKKDVDEKWVREMINKLKRRLGR